MFSPGELNAQTGAPLGNVHSHAELGGNCDACHTAPWDTATMADRCTTCHIDVAVQMRQVASLHGILVRDDPAAHCQDCHPDHRGPTASLVDMNGVVFPHEALGFSLNGHQRNANGEAFTCRDCHTVGVTKFDPATCSTCHSQIDAAFMQSHMLAYGLGCLGCHDGVDRFAKGFDHGKFVFKLTGKHVNVDCASCHTTARTLNDFGTAPTNCFACHQKDDPHAGRFGQDCGTCHTPDGWKLANFNHDLAAFKLTGKHINVPCEQCHVNNVFQGTPKDCYSCHAKDDHHQGAFGTDCASCHTTDGWNNVTVDHSKFAFQLIGKHASVPCEQCHTNSSFKSTPTDCYSCHQKDDAHSGQLGINCSTCHTPVDWKQVTFDHNSAAFKLTGAHVNVSCTQCHVNNVFKGTPTDCYSCHAKDDRHNGQFGADCSACHNTTAWNQVTFDHSKSNFPLTGAHASLQCTQCHQGGQFTALSTACVSCHQDPAWHAGAFGTSCDNCHSTSAWSPAQFNLSHPGIAGGEGGSGIHHGGASCTTCHPATVYQATCLACHDSNNPGDGGGGDHGGD